MIAAREAGQAGKPTASFSLRPGVPHHAPGHFLRARRRPVVRLPAVLRSAAPWLCLLLVAAAIAAWGFLLRDAAGPFWRAGVNDPDYAYLLNSLAIVDGGSVGHGDHPGSTLQFFGAGVILVAHAVAGQGAVVEDVLVRPERYLHAIHAGLMLLLAACAFAAGAAAYRASGRLGVGVLAAVTPFVSVAVHRSLFRASPEPMLLAWALAFVAVLALAGAREDRRRSWKWGAAAGVVLGLAVVTKTTAAPLAAAAMLTLGGLRARAAAIAAAGATFAVLVVNPFMAPSRFFKFTQTISQREGYNRPADPEASLLDAMIDGLRDLMIALFEQEPATLLLIATIVAIAAALALSLRLRQRVGGAMWPRLLWTAAATLAAGVVLVSNGPRAHARYLVPALGLLGLGVVAVIGVLGLSDETRGRALRFVAVAAVATTAVISGLGVYRLELLQADSARAAATAAAAAESRFDDAIVVHVTQLSDVQYALAFGNLYALNRFRPQLRTLYPRYNQYYGGRDYIDHAFGEERWPLEEVFARGKPILVHSRLSVDMEAPPAWRDAFERRTLYADDREKVVLIMPVRDR